MTITMTMMRFRRVAQLWNWLPGFRGVAEHESVHKAAHTLGISPSALSRTVKLLESAIGASLFVRDNNRLELTALGAELLTITRNMMRQVDDCLAREEARRGGEGPLFVGATSEVAAAVVARTLAAHALGTTPFHVLRIDEDGAVDELLRGNVDLVVAGATPRTAEIVVERLGEARFGIYAAQGHPPAALEAASFVATTAGPPVPSGANVACYCDSIEVARTLCEASNLLCALPDVLVSRSPSLRRIADAGEPIALHAFRRAPLPDARAPDESRLAELAGRLRATLAGAER
jgi:DNA-binding transcriptional LysR family regulator